MNKSKILWVFILCLLCFLGCSASEDKNRDKSKSAGSNGSRLESKALALKEIDALQEAFSESEATQAPMSYLESCFGQNENIEIVTNITFENYPEQAHVYRCSPRAITMDEIRQWADILFQGNTAYEPKAVFSKVDIEKQLSSLTARISDRDSLVEEYSGDNQAVDEYILYIEEMISALEDEYIHAPEQEDIKKTDWMFHNYEYYDIARNFWKDSAEYEKLNKSLVFQAKAMVNGYEGEISAYNRDEEDYLMHSLTFVYTNMDFIESSLPSKYIDEETALEMADDMAACLGFSDWYLEDVLYMDPSPSNGHLYESYHIRYVPVYDNIPAYYYPLATVKNSDAHSAHYYYQDFCITIVKGIVVAVSWYSPVEIIDCELKPELIAETEVYEAMKAYIRDNYTMEQMNGIPISDYYTSATVCVENAELKMFRVKDTVSGDFLITPAWIFSGTVALDGAPVWENVDIAAINAVDGSPINIMMGY